MKKIFSLLLLLSVCPLYGQVILENNPTSIKWHQVNTPHFRVLFSKGFDVQAQRMANTLEHIHQAEAKSLGTAPRKISVVLQNYSSESNGFVSMLPRRSEFYAMPPQDYNFSGTNDWLNLLAAHEYRHIVQYQHAMRGFNRLFYYLFGNPTMAGMAQAAAPQWFWEGDAVATETAFTPSGRGRIPNFGLVFRTNLMEGRTFNYHKQYLRSYKHNIPNHYVLGYHMVSYLRRKTGDPDIWGKITARAWRVPFIPFAFSNAIKKETGLYVTDLYEEMAATLKKEWEEEARRTPLTTFDKIHTRTTNAYTDYLYPQPAPDGSVLVLKRGIGDIEQLVRLRDGREEKIFTPGFLNDAGMLSSAEGLIVWNEYGYDPRWRVRNYSLIKAYDQHRTQKLVLSDKKARYASAALSADGKKVVTVRTDIHYQHRLVVLSVPEGTLLKEYPNPNNDFYSMPRWSDDGKIVVLKNGTRGKTIVLFNPATDSEAEIFPPSNENFGHPVLHDNYVLFNSPISGTDNIYAFDLTSRRRYQITASQYGAYNPALTKDGKTIYYNEQTRDGMDVVKIPFDPQAWRVFEVPRTPKTFFQHLVEQEGRPGIFDSIPQTTLPVTRYSKLRGIINPFSWGTFINEDLRHVDIGITSRDILSTTQITAAYTLDLTERTGYWRAGISYQGLYPIFDVAFTQGERSVDEGNITYAKITGDDTVAVRENLTFEWKEKNVQAGIRLPLMTTSSKFSGNVSVANYVGYTAITEFKNSIDAGGRLLPTQNPQYFFSEYLDKGNMLYNHASFTASRMLKRSRRDINSKWGQAIFVDWFSTPYGGDYTGNLLSFYGLAYFPGFFKHHSIYGYWAYQQTQIDDLNLRTGEGLDNYTFRNQVPLPRGHSVSRFEEFYSMSVNYTLPLWYPDIAVGPLLNIQRVRANVFFDYGYGVSTFYQRTVNQTYTTIGGEARFDINILRFLPQLTLGFRYSYGLTPAVTKFEFLLGTFNF